MQYEFGCSIQLGCDEVHGGLLAADNSNYPNSGLLLNETSIFLTDVAEATLKNNSDTN